MRGKKVTYEGIEYSVSFERYGYTDSRFCINGETSSEYMDNSKLTDIGQFRNGVTKAIKEYITRHKSKEEFEKWNGVI